MDGYTVRVDEFGQEYAVPTECGIREQRRIRLKFLLKDAGIAAPPYTLEQYKGEDRHENLPKIKKYIAGFERFRNVNLYFWSKGNASQKTTVAKNMIVELSLKGYSCRFILMADLLSLLQTETYNNGADSKVHSVRVGWEPEPPPVNYRQRLAPYHFPLVLDYLRRLTGEYFIGRFLFAPYLRRAFRVIL
jgi:hypothetical protein